MSQRSQKTMRLGAAERPPLQTAHKASSSSVRTARMSFMSPGLPCTHAGALSIECTQSRTGESGFSDFGLFWDMNRHCYACGRDVNGCFAWFRRFKGPAGFADAMTCFPAKSQTLESRQMLTWCHAVAGTTCKHWQLHVNVNMCLIWWARSSSVTLHSSLSSTLGM